MRCRDKNDGSFYASNSRIIVIRGTRSSTIFAIGNTGEGIAMKTYLAEYARFNRSADYKLILASNDDQRRGFFFLNSREKPLVILSLEHLVNFYSADKNEISDRKPCVKQSFAKYAANRILLTISKHRSVFLRSPLAPFGKFY